jgi:hypothetical protein
MSGTVTAFKGTKMRKCEKCKGPGPCLWSNEMQMYCCVKCHENPKDVFFHMDEPAEGETSFTVVKLEANDPKLKPDWETRCEVCGDVPTMPLTGLCGPCSTGEAGTVGGKW